MSMFNNANLSRKYLLRFSLKGTGDLSWLVGILFRFHRIISAWKLQSHRRPLEIFAPQPNIVGFVTNSLKRIKLIIKLFEQA
jgi:hypothetical protein